MRHEAFSFIGRPKAIENSSNIAGGWPVKISVLSLLAITPDHVSEFFAW